MKLPLMPVALFILISLSGTACAEGLHASGDRPVFFTQFEIAKLQKEIKDQPVGARIAFWAEKFVGTPYDKDPLGAYVSCKKIVCDSEVDCMYMVFRAAELGTSDTPEQARERALDLRFKTRGRLEDGLVTNYDERFDYAEDMVFSGKWGKDITAALGGAKRAPGSRGRETVEYLPKEQLLNEINYSRLRDGDMIFFLKDPAKRAVGEIVGHLGIIKVEDGLPMLIHASGTKKTNGREGGGVVKKVGLLDYLRDTKFIGVMATRF